MNKRGLSSVITTLIIVLLSLVAVGVVWVVISNVLKSGTEQTSSEFGQLLLRLELEKVQVESNGDLKVSVKRDSGGENLDGVAIIISDGTNTQVFEKQESINPLEIKTYTITSSELTAVGFAKEVSIAPLTKKGDEFTSGNIVSQKVISNKEVLKGLGAVSWWKLDGDGKDSIGSTNMDVKSLVSWINGKYGQSMKMSDTVNPSCINQDAGLYTNSLSDTIKNLPKGSFTLSWWNNLPANTGASRIHLASVDVPLCGTCSIWNQLNSIVIRNVAGGNADISYTAPSIDIWHHFVYYFDYPNRKTGIYIDGSLIQEKSLPDGDYGTIRWIAFGVYHPSCVDSIPGEKIDDVVLFNKVLTVQQIKSLYNFDTTK